MIQLGNFNELEIVRFTDHGAYLDGGEVGEILMPKSYVRREMRPGHRVRVFVYLDQQERLVGTTETPLACVGDYAYLEVAWVNEHGAFLHWGLMKDLFVPFSEQKRRMEVGSSYIVYIYIDPETRRIVATAKVERFLRTAPRADYYRGRKVGLLVQQKTPLGFKVIVDNRYMGMLYDDQTYGSYHTGDRLEATVVTLRPDGRLDVAEGNIGKGRFRTFAEELEEELRRVGGFLPYGDLSTPEEIADRFHTSKKTFKRALGQLYRERKVELMPQGVRLTEQE
ncbi:MAG: GntR family transcriptional regulator [Alloprevotella sp.]|nr:GntR family transcriptional regulator [Alloprevotella sp.]